MENEDNKETNHVSSSEYDIVFLAVRVRFHEFFEAVILRLGGTGPSQETSVISERAFPLAVQAAFMAIMYVCMKQRVGPAEEETLVNHSGAQLEEYFSGVRNRVVAIDWLGPHLSAITDPRKQVRDWHNEVRRTLYLEDLAAPFAREGIFLALEEKARFDIVTPSAREDFYGPMFDGVARSLLKTNIDFQKEGLSSGGAAARRAPLTDGTRTIPAANTIGSKPAAVGTVCSGLSAQGPPRVFVNYGSPFDNHLGTRSLSELSRDEQDELIRTVFDPDGEMHKFVMDRDLIKSEPQGLWNAVVAIGHTLYPVQVFDKRSLSETDKIMQVFDKTQLGPRLRAAFSSHKSGCAPFEWARLSGIDYNFFDDCDTLEQTVSVLEKQLGKAQSRVVLSEEEFSSEDSKNSAHRKVCGGPALTGSREAINIPRDFVKTLEPYWFIIFETGGFILFGVVYPIKYALSRSSTWEFALYLLISSLALTVASWIWNPRLTFRKEGGLRSFVSFWCRRFIHVCLVGGFLFGVTRLIAYSIGTGL